VCDSFAFVDASGCWLAKNSDREPTEPQRVEWYDSRTGEGVQKTTYLNVSTPAQRYATWLSRPDWMWGAEMGVNEYGVAIANEAVYTRLINRKSSTLLGMDLLRLGLEQSKSADEALTVLTSYLQQYGQGGPAGFRDKKFFYDNSFLIADANGGWQLETAGDFWAAKKFSRQKPMVAISNDLTIGCDFDLCSDALQDKAKKAGYWNGKGNFNFRRTFATRFMPWAARAKNRQRCNLQHLNTLDSNAPLAPQLAQMLRQHKAGDKHSSNADVCMHATGKLRPSQTTQSMICQLGNDASNVWMTGGSAPCVSLFKPLQHSQSCWLLQHTDFWEDWFVVSQQADNDANFKRQLLQLNQATEAQLWDAGGSAASRLLDNWWQAVAELAAPGVGHT